MASNGTTRLPGEEKVTRSSYRRETPRESNGAIAQVQEILDVPEPPSQDRLEINGAAEDPMPGPELADWAFIEDLECDREEAARSLAAELIRANGEALEWER